MALSPFPSNERETSSLSAHCSEGKSMAFSYLQLRIMFHGNTLRFPGVQTNPPGSKEEKGVSISDTLSWTLALPSLNFFSGNSLVEPKNLFHSVQGHWSAPSTSLRGLCSPMLGQSSHKLGGRGAQMKERT